MLPQESDVVITVSTCRIVVCRRCKLPNGSLTSECAQNADSLGADAMLVLARGQRPFRTGQELPCPPELTARAQWS
jgi:hypothetical protein